MIIAKKVISAVLCFTVCAVTLSATVFATPTKADDLNGFDANGMKAVNSNVYISENQKTGADRKYTNTSFYLDKPQSYVDADVICRLGKKNANGIYEIAAYDFDTNEYTPNKIECYNANGKKIALPWFGHRFQINNEIDDPDTCGGGEFFLDKNGDSLSDGSVFVDYIYKFDTTQDLTDLFVISHWTDDLITGWYSIHASLTLDGLEDESATLLEFKNRKNCNRQYFKVRSGSHIYANYVLLRIYWPYPYSTVGLKGPFKHGAPSVRLSEFAVYSTPHEHNFTYKKQPSCTETGNRVCNICGLNETVPQNHSFVVTKKATCTADGSQLCTKCKCRETIPATGHNFIVTKKATCTTAGAEECAYCHYAKVKKPKQHDYDITVAPTCLYDGKKVCDDCGKEEIMPALGHNFKVTQPATCTAEGVKTCSRCGGTVKMAKAEHKYSASTVAATYFAAGKEVTKCTVCGKVTKTVKIAKKTLKTPTAQITAAKSSLKVKVNKVTGQTGFQIRYRLNGTSKWTTKTYTGKNTVTKTLKLKAKKKYQVGVRAMVKSGSKKAYSAWSKTYSKKTK